MDRVFEVHRKVLRGAIDMFKLCVIVAAVAGLAFFLLILVWLCGLFVGGCGEMGCFCLLGSLSYRSRQFYCYWICLHCYQLYCQTQDY